jgi:hypothetical protein
MNDDASEELSAEARALIARAKGGDDPSPEDRARVRAALMAAVAGGAGLAATSAAASSAAAGATSAGTGAAAGFASVSLPLKVAAVLLVAGGVGGTVIATTWDRDESRAGTEVQRVDLEMQREVEARGPSSARVAASVEPARERLRSNREDAVPAAADHVAEAHAPGARPRAPAREERSAEVFSTAHAERAPQARSRVALARRSERRAIESAHDGPGDPEPQPAVSASARSVATDPASRSTDASTLAEEVGLLRRARAALNAGDPAAALAHLAEHSRRFPAGVLAEERDAARVLALCHAGRRDEARAQASRFLRERPSSPLAARVRESCD